MFSALTACAHEDVTVFYRHISAIYVNSLLSLDHSLILYRNDVTVSSCYVLYVRLSHIHVLLKYCVTVLFNVFINLFIVKLRALGLGSQFLGCILYADNIVIISCSLCGVQHMLNCC